MTIKKLEAEQNPMTIAKKPLKQVFFYTVAIIYSMHAFAAPATHDSNAIKADHLLTIISYIDWSGLKGTYDPINICINKAGAFSELLLTRSLLKQQQGINVNVITPKNNRLALSPCHLVYLLDKTNINQFPQGLFKIGATPMLSSSGTALHFYEHNGKIRMEAFPQRLKQQRISLSSEVLKLARINNSQ